MRRAVLVTATLLFIAACSSKTAPAGPRASLRVADGQWSVVPASGQLPFCLVVEARGSEVVFAPPVTESGDSAPCDADKPIGGKAWKLPDKDIGLKAYVVFSDRPLKGETVAGQIRGRLDEGPHARVGPMDLRAPGQVALEELDIRPAK